MGQLLALGYGRCEVHPVGMELVDERLEAARLELRANTRPVVPGVRAEELANVLNSNDKVPLTLQQLARIAVRRAVGGSNFGLHVLSLKSHLPPILFESVENPMKL